MSNENVNVTKGWLLSFYNQKIKPYLNGTNGALDDSVTSSSKTWSSSKVSSEIKHTYSTTEKAVGTWIDGKTIYEKTFSSTLPTCSKDGTIAISYVSMGASISKGWIVSSFVLNSNVHQIYTCPYFVVTSSSDWQLMELNLNDNSSSSNANTIRIQNNKVSWSGFSIYITVRYIKS